jgi:glycosyltransferase involved in cell wall biosynthesis
MTAPHRLAYLVSHPIQYQSPLLRRLAAEPRLDLTVFFLSDLSVGSYHDPGFGLEITWDVPLLDGYRSEFLPALGQRQRLGLLRPLTRSVAPPTNPSRFDALWVHGYAHQACLRAVERAARLRLPVLLRGESHLTSHPRGRLRAVVKRVFLRGLFRRISGFLAIGTRNRDYYRHYGVPDDRIFPMPYAVDNDFFARRAAEARPARERLRQSLGLAPGRPIVLYASKLMARKRPLDLVSAHARLPSSGTGRPYLVFAGDGPLAADVAARGRELGTLDDTRLIGFRNQTELPALYDLCDVFVLPSEHEPWGLVVNEVMNAARPVVVSDEVGAADDLVADGVNGRVFPKGDVDALASALRHILEEPGRAREMGRQSLSRIARWGIEEDRVGLLTALDALDEAR